MVAAASPVMISMSSKTVDEYWNTLLKVDNGRLYREFSQAVAGRYVQHVEGVGSPDLDARARTAYIAVWGCVPAAAYFTKPPEEALERYRRQTSSSDGGGGDFTTVSFGDGCSSGSDGGSCGGDSSGGGDGGGCGGGCGSG